MSKLTMVVAAFALIVAGTAEAKGLRTKGRAAVGCASCGLATTGGYANCAPTVSYQTVTEYVTVTRQVCNYVPTTTNVEYTEVTLVPRTTESVVEQEYYEPGTEERIETRMVPKMVTERSRVRYCRTVPVTTMVNQSYTTYETKMSVEQRIGVRAVPQTRTVTRTVPVTTFETVAVPGCKTVVVPVASGCASGPGCGTSCAQPACGPRYATVSVPTVNYQCVPKTTEQTYTYNVCEYVPQQYTYNVPVCRVEPRTVTQQVPVTTYRQEFEDRDVDVTVCKMVPQQFRVVYCVSVRKTRQVRVASVSYERQEVRRTRPVTTYNLVTSTVSEQVPVTRCVPVCAAPAPACGPTYAAAPCGY